MARAPGRYASRSSAYRDGRLGAVRGVGNPGRAVTSSTRSPDHSIAPPTVSSRIATAGLTDIFDKLEAGERLTLEDGCRLFEAPDLLAVGWLANRDRERRHGQRTYYNHNIRLEATNVCVA